MSPEQAAGRLDRTGPGQRRLQPGGHPLPPPDRPAAVRRTATSTSVLRGRPGGATSRRRGRSSRASPAPWRRSASRRWRSGPRTATPRPARWPTTSSAGWPTSRSRPTASPGRARAARWLRRHRSWALAGAVTLALTAAVSALAAFAVARAYRDQVRANRAAERRFGLAIVGDRAVLHRNQPGPAPQTAAVRRPPQATAGDPAGVLPEAQRRTGGGCRPRPRGAGRNGPGVFRTGHAVRLTGREGGGPRRLDPGDRTSTRPGVGPVPGTSEPEATWPRASAIWGTCTWRRVRSLRPRTPTGSRTRSAKPSVARTPVTWT